MKEPTRWRTDPSPRSVGADLLLRGARRPRPPEGRELARLGEIVDDIPRRSARAARRATRLTAAAAVAATLVALGTGVLAWRGRKEGPPATDPVLAAVDDLKYGPRPARAVVRPLEEIAEPVAAAPAARPTRAVATRPSRRDRPAHPPAPAETVTDGLAREIALVDAARSDLVGAPGRALAALETHRRTFPRGQLAAEREFLAIDVLRRLNRMDEARRRAAELAVRYPTSSYAARASRLLQPSP